MNFKLKVFFGSIMSILLIYIFLFSSVQLNAFSRDFYKQVNHDLEISRSIHISENDYVSSMDHLLSYMEGSEDNIEVKIKHRGVEKLAFNKKEATHMVDVKNLYLDARLLYIVSIIVFIGLGLILYFDNKHEFFEVMATSFKRVSLVFVVALVAIILFASIDFQKFWTMFHQLFFRNDLWLLDGRYDFMILMMPQDLFFQLVFRIVALFVFLYGVCLSFSIWYIKKLQKDQTKLS